MLSPNEIAEALNVSRKTVYRRILDGTIPSIKISHSCVRVEEADYQKYKDSLKKKREAQ